MLKLVAAFFFYLIVLVTPVLGANVTNISKKKGLIKFSTDGNKTFKKGTKVCIQNTKKIKVGCGKVRSVKSSSGIIKVSKKLVRKIRKGYEVRVAKKHSDSKPTFIIRGFWAGGIIPPVTYNKLTYLPPASSQEASLWQDSGTANGLLLSGGGEVEVPSYKAAAGFRFRSYQDTEFLADYNNPSDNFAVSGSLTSSSIGFYADYYYLKMFGLAIGAGLDIDMNTVSMSATKKDDNGTEADVTIASLESSLTAISLRMPLRYNIAFGDLGITLGGNLMIPIAGSPSTSATVVDSENGSKITSDPSSDLAAALNHTTNSFVIEIIMGAYWGF